MHAHELAFQDVTIYGCAEFTMGCAWRKLSPWLAQTAGYSSDVSQKKGMAWPRVPEPTDIVSNPDIAQVVVIAADFLAWNLRGLNRLPDLEAIVAQADLALKDKPKKISKTVSEISKPQSEVA